MPPCVWAFVETVSEVPRPRPWNNVFITVLVLSLGFDILNRKGHAHLNGLMLK